MSLSSVELNYLIWRYLQEGGHELAAYALQKESQCLDYEHASNKLIPHISTGCLVSLVQKGILYTMLEETADGKTPRLSLPDAVMKEKDQLASAPHAAPTKTEARHETPGSAEAPAQASDEMQVDPDFETCELSPSVSMPASVCVQWHPSSSVVAVGQEDASAAIYALGPGGISETVKLSHPVVTAAATGPSPITCVAWAPSGAMVLTAGGRGELRAWTPDGRLKNIINAAETGKPPAPVSHLLWNTRGSLVLAVDTACTVSVYEGVALALVSEFRGEGPEVHACWIGDHKFAVSTTKSDKSPIQIFSVSAADGLVPAGQLAGHEHVITSLTFSAVSKLLASASDHDYAIRVWNSQSSHDALELNVAAEKSPDVEYHAAPILALCWLSRPGDLEGNELLSVSMDGVVNVWDAFSGDALVSANIFKNPDNFRYSGEPRMTVSTKHALIYAAAVSPDAACLAIGDDSGAVSIWDISRRRGQKHGSLRCLGVFAPASPVDPDFGICDLAWNDSGSLLCVCYKGGDSVTFKWPST